MSWLPKFFQPVPSTFSSAIEWGFGTSMSVTAWKLVHRWNWKKPIAWKLKAVGPLLTSRSKRALRVGLAIVDTNIGLLDLGGPVSEEGIALKGRFLDLASEAEEAAQILTFGLGESVASRFCWAILAQAKLDGAESVRIVRDDGEKRTAVYFVYANGTEVLAVTGRDTIYALVQNVAGHLNRLGFERLRGAIPKPPASLPKSISILQIDDRFIHIGFE